MMEFNKHQKKIMDAVRDKSVFDLTSYLIEFKYTKNFTNESFQKTLSLGEQKYEYDFSTPQVIGSDLSGIYDFLFVWQYLKDNGLIFETEKTILPQDLSVFFTEQPDANDLKFNKDIFKTCQNKIGLRIIPSPGLESFIKRKFKTTTETVLLNSLRAAWTAAIVALVFLIASAVFYAFLYLEANREASYILNQMGILQQNTNSIGRSISDIKDTITGISDKINSFLP
jgi:hypothetical protein